MCNISLGVIDSEIRKPVLSLCTAWLTSTLGEQDDEADKKKEDNKEKEENKEKSDTADKKQDNMEDAKANDSDKD